MAPVSGITAARRQEIMESQNTHFVGKQAWLEAPKQPKHQVQIENAG